MLGLTYCLNSVVVSKINAKPVTSRHVLHPAATLGVRCDRHKGEVEAYVGVLFPTFGDCDGLHGISPVRPLTVTVAGHIHDIGLVAAALGVSAVGGCQHYVMGGALHNAGRTGVIPFSVGKEKGAYGGHASKGVAVDVPGGGPEGELGACVDIAA